VRNPSFTSINVARDIALLGMIAYLTAGPAAQGLGEIARRSNARRVPAGRSYTNADVEPTPPGGSAAATVAAPEPVAADRTQPAGEDKAEAAAARKPLTEAEIQSLQEQAALQRKFSEEMNARLQQRQERVQALRKELKEVQRQHEAGNPAATIAARDALQQSLAEAERQLASAERAVARAEARSRDAAAEAAQVAKP
jgi:hypothetical protein